MAIDRENYSPVILLAKDGTSIGSQAQRFHFGLSEGITTRLIQVIAKSLQTTPEETTQLQNILQGLYKIFVEKDATHLEINPLGRTPTQRLLAIDSNFTIDDAASKRQKDLFDLRDTTHEVAEEVEAEKYGLVYVRMDGNIGNVVNGAGLAMATNDAIGLYGGASANFLDAGGQATKETMQQAFRIILNDERVKSILVNIYGGECASHEAVY